MTSKEQLTHLFTFLKEGSAIGKAILDDYCEVVAKLEGIKPEEVRKRVIERANHHLKQLPQSPDPDQ